MLSKIGPLHLGHVQELLVSQETGRVATTGTVMRHSTW
jgi:hypothetical protein